MTIRKAVFSKFVDSDHILDTSYRNMAQFDVLSDLRWPSTVRSQIRIYATNYYDSYRYDQKGGPDPAPRDLLEFEEVWTRQGVDVYIYLKEEDDE